MDNRIKYLKKVDTKRQYSSINPNSIHGFLGPPQDEVIVGLDSDAINYLSIASYAKSPIKASMTSSSKVLPPVKKSHFDDKVSSKPVSQSPIKERKYTENDDDDG